MRLTRKRTGSTFRRRSNSSIIGGLGTPRKRPKSASATKTNSENLPFNMKRIPNPKRTRPSSAKVEDLKTEVENLRGQLLKLKLDNANQTHENSLIKFIGLLFKQSLKHDDDIRNFLSKFEFSDEDTPIIKGILENNIMALKMLLNDLGETEFTQLETIFKEVGFIYKKLETPGLMSSPVTGEATPSPTPKDPKKELERWEGKRRAADRFEPGDDIIRDHDGKVIKTIKTDYGLGRSPILASPRTPYVVKGSTDDYTEQFPRNLGHKKNQARGSRKKNPGVQGKKNPGVQGKKNKYK